MNGAACNPNLARRLWLLAVLLAVSADPAEAPPRPSAIVQDTEAMLMQAWNAYKGGQVEEAQKIYEQLAEQAPDDAQLLYNLGTTYAKQGLNGFAIWRYLQALRINPRDRETRMNIRLVAPDIFERTAFSPFPPLNMLYGRLTMNEWAAAAGISLAVLLALCGLYFACAPGSRLRLLLRTLAMGAAVATLLTWPLAIFRFYQDEVVWKGVVVGKQIDARAGPDDRQTRTFALPEGAIVKVERPEGDDWLRISYDDGKQVGFIRRDEVRFL